MMGGGWRHQEAEPSCGFVDESFGPAHALRAVWTARGQRARRALPTACPHSRASRPQLHRTDNHFFSQVVCTTGTHAFDPDQPIGSKSPKSLLTSDASRPIIPSSRKRHPTSTSLATRPISPSLSHWTAGSLQGFTTFRNFGLPDQSACSIPTRYSFGVQRVTAAHAAADHLVDEFEGARALFGDSGGVGVDLRALAGRGAGVQQFHARVRCSLVEPSMPEQAAR